MKIIIINGSPKGERSDTFKITKAFLEGMEEEAEVIDTMKVNVKPCLGCYCCWTKTPSVCAQKDDMEKILEKIEYSDLVIWSTPLYCYSIPSNCKAVMDRLLPLSTKQQNVDEKGETYHPSSGKLNARHILISGSGFPDRAGNFDALEFQFQRMFGKDIPMILCPESPMFSVPMAAVVTKPYLSLVKEAGAEFKETGAISDAIQEKLSKLMIPADEYRKMCNS